MNETQVGRWIYPSIVTYSGNWRKMIQDVKLLKIHEISLFLTTVGVRERKRIYAALRSTSVRSIPHVHARSDMNEEELDFFVKTYKTKAITIHFQFIDLFKNSRHKKIIFAENNFQPRRIEDLKNISKIGGICIDLSHLEEFHYTIPHLYEITLAAQKKYKVGCNHISGVRANGLSSHYITDKKQFDYLLKIPKKFFSKYLNIELANPIREQLEFKKYIAHLLAKAWSK